MRFLVGAACCALLAAAPATAAAAAARPDGVPAFGHVFVIVGENTSASQITRAHAPFITGTLEPRAARLTRYSVLPRSSSLGQYIGMMSGQFIRCEADNDLPSARCHQSVPNLFAQLDRTHRTWMDWQESMTNACDIFDHGSAWSRNIYSAHHNPAIYFTGIEGGRYDEALSPRAECRADDVPTGSNAPDDTSALDAALASGQVGDFNLIVPNDCEDGHDPCGTHDRVRQFDAFLAREVPLIEASPAFGGDGVIFITWDEGSDPPLDPRHVLTLVAGRAVRPGAYSQRVNHYGLLRTIEDGLGLSHLAHARTAHAIRGAWQNTGS